jgi:hypothetical protein
LTVYRLAPPPKAVLAAQGGEHAPAL